MKRRVRFPKPCFCCLCGGPVTKDFAFEVEPTRFSHPSCLMFTNAAELTQGEYPSRTLRKGQRVVSTCGNPICVCPAHLEAVDG